MTDEESSLADERQLRLEGLRADIAARLESVCADWPVEMFEEMVRGLAAITVKYERRSASSGYDRRSSERLVADMKDLVERSIQLRKSITPPDGGDQQP